LHRPECRKSDQQLRRRFQRYGTNIVRADLSIKELAALVSDASFCGKPAYCVMNRSFIACAKQCGGSWQITK
jgi:hypothetical protein